MAQDAACGVAYMNSVIRKKISIADPTSRLVTWFSRKSFEWPYTNVKQAQMKMLFMSVEAARKPALLQAVPKPLLQGCTPVRGPSRISRERAGSALASNSPGNTKGKLRGEV
jgi:hypothetical protein